MTTMNNYEFRSTAAATRKSQRKARRAYPRYKIGLAVFIVALAGLIALFLFIDNDNNAMLLAEKPALYAAFATILAGTVVTGMYLLLSRDKHDLYGTRSNEYITIGSDGIMRYSYDEIKIEDRAVHHLATVRINMPLKSVKEVKYDKRKCRIVIRCDYVINRQSADKSKLTEFFENQKLIIGDNFNDIENLIAAITKER